MSDEWQPIETAPKDGACLLFFGKRIFRHLSGEVSSLGEVREAVERTVVGFFDNGDICEAGSGHSVLEDWRGEEGIPTHWMPLPKPPVTP